MSVFVIVVFVIIIIIIIIIIIARHFQDTVANAVYRCSLSLSSYPCIICACGMFHQNLFRG